MGPLERIFWTKVIFLFVYFIIVNAQRQRIVQGPSNTTVRLNETVVLKCQVENQVGAVQWIKNGFGLGIYREISLFTRYSMIGSPSLGEYHLQIVNTSLEDDDVFECQIETAQSNPGQISKPAKLSVIAEPQAPYFVGADNEKPISVVEGKTFELACRSDGGKPAAKLAWVIAKDAEGREIVNWLVPRNSKQFQYEAQVTEAILIDADSGLESIISNLSFIPTQTEDGRYILCLATHEAYSRAMKHVGVSMNVSYPPKASVKVDQTRSLMREGGQAVLLCQIDAKPKTDLSIYWYRNDKIVALNNSHTLVVPNLRMEDHLSEIVCRVRNSVGETKAAIHLNIAFAPRIMSSSQTKDVERGGTTTFHCEALGNPEPQIHWTHKERENEIVSKGKFFSIDSVQLWNVGQYDCVATVEGFPPTKIPNFLHLKGPPIVQFTRNMIRRDGESLVLTCEIRGKPFPKQISWLRDAKPVKFEESSGHFQTQDVHRDFGIESKLTIIKVSASDYGLYNCTAQNEFGFGSMAAIAEELGILDQLQNFQVIAGVPAAVLLSILIAVIFLSLLAYLLFYVCRKICGNKNKGTRFNDEHSDVTIKCEALDGANFYTDMYGRADMENSELILAKDYISLPQNNPDLDYLPPPQFVEPFHHQRHYLNPHVISDYAQSDTSARFEPYGSFTSGQSTPGIQGLPPPDMYSSNGNTNGILYSKNGHTGPAPLETLTEVATPDSGQTPLLIGRDEIRPISRVSTHV